MPEPEVYNYDPNLWEVIVLGTKIRGFVQGTFVSIARDTPPWGDKAGVGGDVVRSKSADNRATATLTLMAESPSNEELQRLLDADLAAVNGAGVGGFRMAALDGSGRVIESAKAWVMTPPDESFANESGEREWQIRLANKKVTPGSVPQALG